jgi:hypothetical protein
MTDDKKRKDECPICNRPMAGFEQPNGLESQGTEPIPICSRCADEIDPPDPIRATAEETIKRLGQMVFGPSDLSAIRVVEQAIRAQVERECLGALCEGCKLGLKEDPKWILCRGCLRLGHILDRIRQGGK